MELTAEEVRQIQEQRAQSAIETRPIDQRDAILKVFVAMRALVLIGKNLDPNDQLWDSLFHAIPEAPI